MPSSGSTVTEVTGVVCEADIGPGESVPSRKPRSALVRRAESAVAGREEGAIAGPADPAIVDSAESAVLASLVGPYHEGVLPRPDGDDWIGLSNDSLPVESALAWAIRPDCGAQVLFSGTVRDHAEGRTGVTELAYEAYVEQVEPRLTRIAAEARRRWPMLGRLVLLHRIGVLTLGECSVLVVASSPHRPEAFEAARWCIDTLKATVPIWKQETWEGGTDWGLCAHDVSEVGPGAPSVGSADPTHGFAAGADRAQASP
jgi:molybdopterin synthase catalytic subunit